MWPALCLIWNMAFRSVLDELRKHTHILLLILSVFFGKHTQFLKSSKSHVDEFLDEF